MRYRSWLRLCVVAIMLVSGTASAATRYVSDQLSINMRRGAGNTYRITKLLDAGTQVQTLSESDGWSKIRIPDGNIGFVLTRFLSDTPAASTQLDQMKQQTAKLQTDNSDLKAELAQALHGSSQLGELKRNLVNENQQLKSQLQNIRETSADAIRIGNENQKYRSQLMSLRSDVDSLRHENQALQSRRDGMKIGALILIGGVLIGLVLPMFRRRRGGGNWNSL